MKAAIRHTYGSPDSIIIKNVEKPNPKENEILIKVCATTVNRTDCAILSGNPIIMRLFLGILKPGKEIIGTDFAGYVEAVGSNVSSFKLNDKVFGFNDLGYKTQAEYLILHKEDNVLLIPENLNYFEGAASLEGAHYAYSFIHKVKINKGQRILINGATGAIGSALLQFLKQFEVHISATCSTKNIDLVKSIGADKIFDYSNEDFTKNPDKYDYVFDAVGNSSFRKCKPILKKRGVYISSEPGLFAQNLLLALTTSIAGNKKVIFPKPFSIKRTMPYISRLLKRGEFKPIIDRYYKLSDISKAYEFVLSGKKTGNVIINLES